MKIEGDWRTDIYAKIDAYIADSEQRRKKSEKTNSFGCPVVYGVQACIGIVIFLFAIYCIGYFFF